MNKFRLILFFLTISGICQGQSATTYTLILKDIVMEYNGDKTPIEEIQTRLYSNKTETIEISTADRHRYFLEAKILIRGNRIKLSMRNYLTTATGKTIKGKPRKYVHYLKVGINKTFEGNGTESLLIDADNIKAMKAIYKFELKYSE